MPNVIFEKQDTIAIVTLNRPDVRNAVDARTAIELFEVFLQFDADESLNVAVFTGAEGVFCAGADLKAIAAGDRRENDEHSELAPMGPTRLRLTKPVIGAIEGFAVAGGLELALWCDLRIAARDAVFGVYCRRFGVPLIDLGTVRLPRLIGHSNAMDLILTGRGVQGEEALRMGLANRLVETGEARAEALSLARQMAAFPQNCLRSDRLSAYEQWDLSWDEAIRNEYTLGKQVLDSGEAVAGASRFAAGEGKHGAFK